MPKVSVIIPVYNIDEKKLRKGLDSLLAQTLQDIEFICVDDGSKNNEALILEEYKNKDPRFVIIRQENKGIGAARQTGIEHAAGEYIGFMDADDYISPLMYEKMYNQAKTLDSDIVECGFELILDWTKKTLSFNNIDKYNQCQSYIKFEENINYTPHQLEPLIFTNLSNMIWDKIYKTKFIKENSIKSLSIEMGEDVYFSLNALLSAQKISFVKDVFYTYIQHEKSSIHIWDTKQKGKAYKKHIYNILEKHPQFKDKLKPKFNKHLLSCYVFAVEREPSIKKRRETCKYFKENLEKEEYQKFIALKKENDKKAGRNFLSSIFSIKTLSADGTARKIIMFFGFKISFKKKRVEN